MADTAADLGSGGPRPPSACITVARSVAPLLLSREEVEEKERRREEATEARILTRPVLSAHEVAPRKPRRPRLYASPSFRLSIG
jgi:hypothetical protein